MGTIAPIPAGGAGNLPQIKPPTTPGITPPNAGIPIQVPIGQAPVVKLPVGQTPNLHPGGIQASKPADVNTYSDIKLRIASLKQKIGDLLLESTDGDVIWCLDTFMRRIGPGNVNVIEALLKAGPDTFANHKTFIQDSIDIGQVLADPHKAEIFTTFFNRGETICDAKTQTNDLLKVILDSSIKFIEKGHPTNILPDEIFSVASNLLKTTMNSEFTYSPCTDGRRIELFNRLLETCKFKSKTKGEFLENIQLAEALMKSPKLMEKPGGYSKISLLIEHKEAYETLIKELIEPNK